MYEELEQRLGQSFGMAVDIAVTGKHRVDHRDSDSSRVRGRLEALVRIWEPQVGSKCLVFIGGVTVELDEAYNPKIEFTA